MQVIQLWYIMISFWLWDIYDDGDVLWLIDFFMHMYWKMLLTSFLSVQDTWQVMDVDSINGLPWNLDWVRGWIVFWLIISFSYMWHMINYSMIYIYGLMTHFFLVDGGLMMLSNPTHIRSRGVVHRNHTLRERCGNVFVMSY
jgi:hypothetical protein